jgi:hypothetical protein
VSEDMLLQPPLEEGKPTTPYTINDKSIELFDNSAVDELSNQLVTQEENSI